MAAVLNFFVWGLGYVYVGKRTPLMLMAIGGVLLDIPWVLGFSSFGQLGTSDFDLIVQIVSGLGSFIVGIALANDAYQLAKEPPSAS